MRRIAAVVLGASLAALLAVPAGAGGSVPQGLSPREARAYQRHLDMVARGVAHGAGQSVDIAGPQAPATSVVDVQEISRWSIDAQGQDDTEAEPDIAVDPNDPNHMTGAFQQGRFSDGTAGAAAIGFSTSHDGGTTWTHGTLPGITKAYFGPYDRATDPAVAFGPNGEVYIESLFFNASNNPNGFMVSRSDDGGLTWGAPMTVVNDGAGIFNDKGWIAVDTFPSSPFFGRVYVTFTRNGLQMKYSDDRGQTWSALKTINNGGTDSQPVVLPTGILVVVYENGFAFARRSTNGGDSFGAAVQINSVQATEPSDMRTGGFPAAAVDRVTGSLYAAWQDTRFRSDGLNDIVVTRSTDGGVTWSQLLKVSAGTSGDKTDLFTADVAANNHLVFVAYRGRLNRSSTTMRYVGEAFVFSADDGFDFGPETRISPLSDNNYSAKATGLIFYGDYMGSAAGGTEAHLIWERASQAPDHPTGPHQTSWSATILTP